MADPSNGQMTIYSNDMKSYGMRNGIAKFLEYLAIRCAWVWMEARRGLDARPPTMQASRRPSCQRTRAAVRVQWMRQEETAWDTKGPAFTFKLRGGLDSQGNLIALDHDSRAADYITSVTTRPIPY